MLIEQAAHDASVFDVVLHIGKNYLPLRRVHVKAHSYVGRGLTLEALGPLQVCCPTACAVVPRVTPRLCSACSLLLFLVFGAQLFGGHVASRSRFNGGGRV